MHGIHAFREKPIDETAEKIASLYKVANAAGISLCCGFQRRFDASYVAAAEATRDGKVGVPVTANIFFADHPSPPKEFLLSGGNIFMGLSAHDMEYALDDEVVSVYATGTSSTEELEAAGVHNNANMVMKFSKGKINSISISFINRLDSRRGTREPKTRIRIAPGSFPELLQDKSKAYS